MLVSLPIRFYFLQKYEFDIALDKSKASSERSLKLLSRRGKILDRNFQILAEDIPAYEIGIQINNFSFDPSHISSISKILKIDSQNLKNKLSNKKRQYIVLDHNASQDELNELNEEKIQNTIIADNTGGILMQRGEVDMCIVGTDRTLSNGDVCNKVGTYLKALAAHDNNIPFYVALPSSTIDWNIKDHKKIPIEERNSEELSHVEGIDEENKLKKIRIYPQKSKSLNLAFDVTPAKYVTGLITEKGVCEASEKGLKGLFK